MDGWMPIGSASPQIRIKLPLVGNGGLWTVSAKDLSIGGESCKLLQTLRHFLPTASLKVGTSDTHAEEGVTGEGDMLVLTVIDTSAGGVPRGMQDVEMMGAEMNLLTVCEVMTDRCFLFVQLKSEKVRGLLTYRTYTSSINMIRLRFRIRFQIPNADCAIT